MGTLEILPISNFVLLTTMHLAFLERTEILLELVMIFSHVDFQLRSSIVVCCLSMSTEQYDCVDNADTEILLSLLTLVVLQEYGPYRARNNCARNYFQDVWLKIFKY